MKRPAWLYPWELDLRSLGLFRVLLGLAVLYQVSWRLADLDVWYGPQGFMTPGIRDALMGYPDLSPFGLASGNWAVALTLLVMAALGVLLALGWRARAVALALAGLFIAVQAHNPVMLSGDHRVTLWALIWAALLPVGARFAPLGGRPSPAAPTLFAGVAALGLLVQVGVSYLFNGLSKSHPAWDTGEALPLILQAGMFTRPAGEWLLGFPHEGLQALAVAVRAFEVAALGLLLLPFAGARLLTVLALMALHLGFAVFMSVGFYPFACVVWLVALLPPAVWERGRQAAARVRLRARPFTSAVAGALLAYVVAVNAAGYSGALPEPLRLSASTVGLFQAWRNFTTPHFPAGHPLVVAELESGQRVDLYRHFVAGRDGRELPLGRPAYPPGAYGNPPWPLSMADWRREAHRKHAEMMIAASPAVQQNMAAQMGLSLCRRWEDGGGGAVARLAVGFWRYDREAWVPFWVGGCGATAVR